VSGINSIIGGGINNIVTGGTSVIVGGSGNTIGSQFSFIGGGSRNTTLCNNTFILGSNISATTNNTIFTQSVNVLASECISGNQETGILVRGSNTVGGSTFLDFMRGENTAASATNNKKTFRINQGGVFEIVNNAYSTVILSLTDAGVLSTPGGGTSDIRTKTNIEYIDGDYTPFINKLKPVRFEFNGNIGVKRHGFIAQDVLEIKPDLVLGDGDNEKGTYGLDYDGILSLTVKSLQEANSKIKSLEEEITNIKALLNK
jgi:hypothetical protein